MLFKKFWVPTNREAERARIVHSFSFFEVPEKWRAVVLDALGDSRWDWFVDCDGCTAVSEPGWPTKYYPPCLVHDWRWHTGQGGWASNKEFYELQQVYHMERWRARGRWFGVTVAWYSFYKWRDLVFGAPSDQARKWLGQVEGLRAAQALRAAVKASRLSNASDN